MELLNDLSPFHNLPLSITLHKVNKYIFGNETIELNKKEKIYQHLLSPLDTIFLEIRTENFEENDLKYGDIIIVERNRKLRVDGFAVVKINNQLTIANISHDKNFNTVIFENGKKLICDTDFSLIGTITYRLSSYEENYLEMLGEDLFKVY